MQIRTFLLLAGVAFASANAAHHPRKRLADNFDTLTEPITGSETSLDSSKQPKTPPMASSPSDSMWKNVPNIQGPAGISTGHAEYNTAGKRRDVESWPSDLETAKDKFNADFKNHHVAATVKYASDILEATQSFSKDVAKMARTRRDEDQYVGTANTYADAISDAVNKYVQAVGEKPISASADYAETITKATADFSLGLVKGVRKTNSRDA